MTEIQKSVRAFLTLPTHKKFAICQKLGYKDFVKEGVSLDEADKLFFQWVKENKKLAVFIEEIKDYKNNE